MFFQPRARPSKRRFLVTKGFWGMYICKSCTRVASRPPNARARTSRGRARAWGEDRGQADEGTKRQREEETKGRREDETEGRRHEGTTNEATQGRRHEGRRDDKRDW